MEHQFKVGQEILFNQHPMRVREIYEDGSLLVMNESRDRVTIRPDEFRFVNQWDTISRFVLGYYAGRAFERSVQLPSVDEVTRWGDIYIEARKAAKNHQDAEQEATSAIRKARRSKK
jgi:hypothetical protein